MKRAAYQDALNAREYDRVLLHDHANGLVHPDHASEEGETGS